MKTVLRASPTHVVERGFDGGLCLAFLSPCLAGKLDALKENDGLRDFLETLPPGFGRRTGFWEADAGDGREDLLVSAMTVSHTHESNV